MPTRKRPVRSSKNPIENRNFLSPVGFKFALKRSPAVAFFCNEASIPSLDLGIAAQPTYLKDVPLPGDKIQFGDLSLRFLVDEDLKNYMEIQNWIRGLGFPESLKEFHDLQKEGEENIGSNYGELAPHDIYSDGTLHILSSNLVPKFKVVFNDLFPYTLSTVTFDATDTDIEYFTADVTFKYTIYKITDIDDNEL